MSLLPLIFALFDTLGGTIKESIENRRALAEQRRYENIDFENIASVTFDGTMPASRIETEYEFDLVSSVYWTDIDGWAHYETKPVDYEVPDGNDYCFTIRYKDGTEIYRKFHESSPLTERLLTYCNQADISKEVAEVEQALNEVVTELKNIFAAPSPGSYEDAARHFSQMRQLYQLGEKSSQEDFAHAAEIKLSSLIMAEKNEFFQSIYELMLYLLSTKEDGDILEIISHSDLSFIQQTEKGTDAFSVLPKGEDITDKTLGKFEKIRKKEGYRKIVLLTIGKNLSTVSNPNIVIWDLEQICAAYLSAFKKSVKEPTPQKKTKKPKEHFAVIDFETTGLNYNFRSPPMDEILSVAIVDQDGNEVFHTYCNTIKLKTWYKAQTIHGISPKDVKGYPTFVEIMPKVIEILSSFDYVISYNVPFEKFFLENYAQLYTPKDFSIQKIRWGRDPMEMFMNYMNSNKFLSLETAAEHFGYHYNAHDALEDARAALHVYNALQELR